MKGGMTIWCFIKFFEKEEFADAFVGGSLYLNTIGYFKGLESQSDDGRADPTEATQAWLQPHDVNLTISVPGIERIIITEKDLAAPISFGSARHEAMNVLCLYAVYTNVFERDLTDNMCERIDLDPSCAKLGEFAVIFSAQPFLEQLRSALTAHGLRAEARLVNYYDDKTFHGEIPTKDIPFWKQERFSSQKEFRLCVYPKTTIVQPLRIEIGSLSGVCKKLNASELPAHLILQSTSETDESREGAR